MKVTYVLHNRFGVWTRCMTAPDVRHYIGLNGGRTYAEVQEDIRSVQRAELQEVVHDLSPQSGGGRPVLSDSRDTVYGQILTNKVARQILRRHGDLQVARQVVQLVALPDRLRDLRERIDAARDEAQQADYSRELGEAAEDLWRSSRTLRATVAALQENATEDGN